jgi:hypothetical protein
MYVYLDMRRQLEKGGFIERASLLFHIMGGEQRVVMETNYTSSNDMPCKNWVYSHVDFSFRIHTQNTLQVPKEFLVLVGGAVLVAILFFGIGAGSLCSIVGFIYPAFKSFEVIESKTRGDDTQWLIYWVVYAFFAVIESFSDFLLYWIPFYYAFKVRFLFFLCVLE